MTIGKKLTWSFGAMALITLILGVASLSSVGSLKQSFDTTANKSVRKVELSDTIARSASDMLAAQRGLVMFTFGKDPARRDQAGALFESAATKWANSLSEMRPLLTSDRSRQLANQLEGELGSWREAFGELQRACVSGRPEEGLRIAVEKGVPIYDAVQRDSGQAQETHRQVLDSDKQSAADIGTASWWIAIALSCLSLTMGVAGLIIVRRTSRALQSAASELAQGAQQISGAASQVASSSQSLAQGSSEQAASLEETSASTEEITSMTRKNAENSKSAAELMSTVDTEIQRGNQTLEQMVASMQEINASSDKISKIIKVIDEIAFQTNILALNAAVEAARAGEAGMGFAVVADEVRNLAQRSAQAAKDTAGLIEESITTSHDGSDKLQKVADVIKAITESAAQVKTLVDEVNMGSQEQARGIDQISKAVAQMDQVTQTTAANAEESASASEELSAQAQALHHIVTELETLVGHADGSVTMRDAEKPPSAATPSIKGSLKALKSAVSLPKPKSKPLVAAPVASSKREMDEFPLDDNFSEM